MRFDIPSYPGCYLFKDNRKKVIYIGKAKNLKKRVSSYFQKRLHDAKTQELVSEIVDCDYIVTDNEIEALILESSLIKKHKPKFNIMLKDMFAYSYIMVTNEPYPRLLTVRKVSKDKNLYFGPYVSGRSRTIVLKFLRDVFKIRTCTSPLPKRVCLRFHIDRCNAPCIDKITQSEYQTYVDRAVLFLKGKNSKLLKGLKSDMTTASKSLNFELALTIRDQIQAIIQINKRQNIDLKRTFDMDIINYFHDNKRILIEVFNMTKGLVQNQKRFEFTYKRGIFLEFIKQYYLASPLPDEIILPSIKESNLSSYFEKVCKRRVKIITPKRGKKQQLLALVKKNAKLHFSGTSQASQTLKEKLKLSRLPSIIDCFDVSNIQGDLATGSVVRSINGKLDKSNYRRFKIRGVSGPNDPAMIQEIVFRRYASILEHSGDLPDLIMVDGGITQLNAAKTALRNLNVNIDLIGLAKKQEAIYVLHRRTPVLLSKRSKGLQRLQQLRDEAHRFAITYHKFLRHKKTIPK